MLYKTKAALQGRQCNHTKPIHITRLTAGGQIVSKALKIASEQNQPFGSMPRCFSSLRTIRLIQAAKDSSPSCCWAFSINSLSSGSSRNWNGGLPRLSFLCVDTSITPVVVCLCVMTHYIQMTKKTTPRSAGTLPRRLTKTLNGVTLWLPLMVPHPRALKIACFSSLPYPVPIRTEQVIATSEREARLMLVGRYVLSFAGCLPVSEAYHE